MFTIVLKFFSYRRNRESTKLLMWFVSRNYHSTDDSIEELLSSSSYITFDYGACHSDPRCNRWVLYCCRRFKQHTYCVSWERECFALWQSMPKPVTMDLRTRFAVAEKWVSNPSSTGSKLPIKAPSSSAYPWQEVHQRQAKSQAKTRGRKTTLKRHHHPDGRSLEGLRAPQFRNGKK